MHILWEEKARLLIILELWLAVFMTPCFFLKTLKNICVGFLIPLFYFYEFPFLLSELDLPYPELFLRMSVF